MFKKLFVLFIVVMISLMSFSFSSEIPILMYHDITPEKNNDSVVSEKKFAKDMKQLQTAGYTFITLRDMYKVLDSEEREFPKKPVVITFDDGYLSNYKKAYPILEELQAKATISIIGAAIGRQDLEGYENYRPHFDEEAMKEIHGSGVIDIQNHTYDLHSLEGKSIYEGNSVGKGMLPKDNETFPRYGFRIARDLIKNNYILLEIVDYKPEFVIYPFGVYNEDTENIIKAIGFKGSVTTKHGIKTYQEPEDLYEMPRLNVTNEVNVLELINNTK